jgi:Zn-dependent peptidase ImmA (M78 family)
MTDPPADLVDALGEVLGFSPEFFYRPVEDPFTEQQCNFRHRRTAPEKIKTQVRAHATLIGEVIDTLRKRLKFPKENVPAIPAKTPTEIEAAAETTRKHWGLGVEAPLLHVGRVLENAGVVIVPHFVESTKIDAFSRYGRTTVIFLNQAIKSTSRWIFDIGHECGHLVIHRDAHTGTEETEQAADRFASAFLLPNRAFSRDFRAASFSWQHIFELKRHWLCSAAAIVRRAYDLGILS